MGALGFDTFKELLKFRLGNNAALDSAGASSLNYYGIWINSAYRQLCSQDDILGLNKNLYFPQLMTSTTSTTVDGTAYIDVPSDCLYIEQVFDTTNGKLLDNISWKDYIEYTDRTTAASEGDPNEWVRHGSRIYLHPTPGTTGDTITVYYKRLVSDLTGTQTTLIGAEWDDVIIELATYKAFMWTHEDAAKIKAAKENFVEMAAGLADIYNKEEENSEVEIAPSLSYLGK